jgi:hypothetical protein
VIEVVRSVPAHRERDQQYSEHNSITLLPGESFEYCVFRSWNAPGAHKLILTYEARCADHPFARLTYPTVAVQVRAPEAWILWAHALRPQPQ